MECGIGTVVPETIALDFGILYNGSFKGRCNDDFPFHFQVAHAAEVRVAEGEGSGLVGGELDGAGASDGTE